jgi:hypothetical protein
VKKYPSLTPDHSNNPNNNIVLKAQIIQMMLSIEGNFRNDKVNNDGITLITDSPQECYNCEQVFHEP